MRIPTLPDWTKGLPGVTMLYSCDILEFFQYNHKTGKVGGFILAGLLPKPIAINYNHKLNGSKRATKYYWLLGDIRKLRISMLEKEANK